jgi:CrcB protein
MLYLWIALFGLIGTFARFGMQGLVQRITGAGFPWGTFVVNVTGSFLVGFVARVGTGSAALSPDVRAGLLVGLCGGYTTFSTFSYETLRLLQDGAYVRGGAYAAGSVLVSLAATAVGMQAAARVL